MENEKICIDDSSKTVEVDNSSYLYTIVDNALKERTNIFDAKNDKIAIRHFIGLISNVQDFCKKDFELYCIAEVNTHMYVDSYVTPILLCDGLSCEDEYNAIEFNEA